MSSEHTNVLSCLEVEQCPIALEDDGKIESPIFNTDGLRVLAVDDNLVCLKVLVALLHQCKYNVTETSNPVEALQILRTRKHEFDIVITDLRMLEMDGLVLLQKISLEMDLPVVMLSADDKQENILKAVRYGARDYIIKPPRMAQIKNVWQHVVRKRLFEPSRKDVNNHNNASTVTIEEETKSRPPQVEGDSCSEKGKAGEEGACILNGDTDNVNSRVGSKKKKRVTWTADLHNKFTDAIEKIGRKAVPMEILKEMNVPWLTRANVASHLQKYKNLVRSQGQSFPQARNGYSKYMNSAAGQNEYQSMITKAIDTNPNLPQKYSYQRNNQNLKIFPQVTDKELLNYNQHYNLPVNTSSYLAPTMLNNAPLPHRNVLTSHLNAQRFNGHKFSTMGNNMKTSSSFCQPALFPPTVTYRSAVAGNMPAATSSVVNADSKQNHMLGNGQKYVGIFPETESIYPQQDWTSAPDFSDTGMINTNLLEEFDNDEFHNIVDSF